MEFVARIASPGLPGERESRIMDLDQYLEKMNTNTNVIWIQELCGLF